jgi:hypothetical protein
VQVREARVRLCDLSCGSSAGFFSVGRAFARVDGLHVEVLALREARPLPLLLQLSLQGAHLHPRIVQLHTQRRPLSTEAVQLSGLTEAQAEVRHGEASAAGMKEGKGKVSAVYLLHEMVGDGLHPFLPALVSARGGGQRELLLEVSLGLLHLLLQLSVDVLLCEELLSG